MSLVPFGEEIYDTIVDVNNGQFTESFRQGDDAEYDIDLSTQVNGPDTMSESQFINTNGTFVILDYGSENVDFTGDYDFNVSGSISAECAIIVDGTEEIIATSDDSGTFSFTGGKFEVKVSSGGDPEGDTTADVNLNADLGITSDYTINSITKT